ncbi:hypothetical protein SBOR_2200 [Sclerotinia borealis F-4128]|uniref:Voltage-gated hydrogen channel 1 n=1 Tax=Sclerotinia borealis (strain F-4128) TaxID=1432307 RepID=W9CKV4_SCLBF|nr:hypothetical protein SBOR_2200 [Sclerotinia borealis F-4128]
MSRRNSSFSEHAPLIRASSQPISITSGPSYHHIPRRSFFQKLSNSYRMSRTSVKTFLSSGAQHYTVLLLVACDLIGIFADIIINLYQCDNDKEGKTEPIWNEVRDGLGIAGLIFSCFFMVELIASVWAFGWRYVFLTVSFLFSDTVLCTEEINTEPQCPKTNKLLVDGLGNLPRFWSSTRSAAAHYFRSKFHCFDAAVILAGFIVDVLLHGVLEEVASLVIILRLWRFFKIIEEFSVGAQEQMDGLEERIEQLEMKNRELMEELRTRKGGDEDLENGEGDLGVFE